MYGEDIRWKPSNPAIGFTNYDAVRRHIHKSIRVRETTSKPPPSIDRVSLDECYLLNSAGQRHRRICGALKKHLPPEYPCLSVAGAQTIHRGFGRCHRHDKRTAEFKQYNFRSLLEEVVKKNPENQDLIAKTLLDYEMALPDVSASLSDLNQELRTLYALLALATARPDTQFGTKSFVKSVSELIANIVKLKKAQKEIDLANNYIALTDLNRFLDQLIAVVGELCGRSKASEVFSRVKETIVIGYNPEALKQLSMTVQTGQVDEADYE